MTVDAGKDIGREEHLFISGGSKLGVVTMEISVIGLKTDLSWDPAIPSLGMNPKDSLLY